MNFIEDIFNMITIWLNEENVWKLRQINKRTKQIIETNSLHIIDKNMYKLYVYYNKYFYIFSQNKKQFEIYYCSLGSITFDIYDIIIISQNQRIWFDVQTMRCHVSGNLTAYKYINLKLIKYKFTDTWNDENILFSLVPRLKLDKYQTSQEVITYLENVEKMINNTY